MDATLAREAKALYELPANEFTTGRNDRAKALRKENPELAAQVAKLPKPTAAAAAVNMLARRDPSEVRALIQAGKRLRDAQERAVAGRRGGENLQEAVREHRAALERVQREVRRLRLSESVLERAVSTFRAASIDPELQPLLERGLLAREVESAGFAIDPSLAVAPAGKRTSRASAQGHREAASGSKGDAEKSHGRARGGEARSSGGAARAQARRAHGGRSRPRRRGGRARGRRGEAEARAELSAGSVDEANGWDYAWAGVAATAVLRLRTGSPVAAVASTAYPFQARTCCMFRSLWIVALMASKRLGSPSSTGFPSL